jgi:hypothetical protein
MKTKEEKRNQQPSPPTIRTPLPYRNMSHLQENNKRNGNGKETGMENQRGKDTGYPDNPHSLRPKEATLPYREKSTSPNDPLPLAKSRASFSLLPKELPSLPQKTTTSLSPPLKTKQPPDDKPIHTLPRHDRGA